MLGRYERRTWQHDPTLNAPVRYRNACSYDAFIPLPIADLEVSLSGSVAATVSSAEAAIQELNSGSQAALSPLARLLLRTESIASSKVEGMQVDARALARAEAAADTGQRTTPTALEVLGNIEAMQLAIERATTEESVRIEELIEIHRVLLERAPNAHIAGRIRIEQNWIGGNNYNPCGADFVPPPPEEIDSLLGDLGRFCSEDRLPPLIQAAIAHAQFETIHPFDDGNGRTGRALVQVILRRRGLAPAYVPPISVVLAANKEQYISGLTAYREGRVEAWLEVFSVAAERAAHLAGRYLTAVGLLQDQWRSILRGSARIRSDAAAWKLIDVLPAQPVVTLPSVVARIDRTKPAANLAIEQLVTAGILLPISTGRRNRMWEAAGLLDVMTQLESGEQLRGELDLGPIPDASEWDSVAEGERSGPNQQQISPLPYSDPIFRLAPGAWLASPTEEAEITFRLAVAMPNVLPLGGSGSIGLVTQLRGQRREERLIEMLDASPVGKWLQSLQRIWRWSGTVEWTPTGSGSLELTELWFAPFGVENRHPSFMARCGFATGLVDSVNATPVPSIEAAVDVMLNIRELGTNRHPDNIRHATDQPPAPTALSLREVADILGHLFGFIAVTEAAARSLLPPPQPNDVKVGAWVSITGGLADRVIDLHAFRRIPRSSGVGQAVGAFHFDLSSRSQFSDDDVRAFVAELLYEGLERGGYRDLDEAIADLRLDPGPGRFT